MNLSKQLQLENLEQASTYRWSNMLLPRNIIKKINKWAPKDVDNNVLELFKNHLEFFINAKNPRNSDMF